MADYTSLRVRLHDNAASENARLFLRFGLPFTRQYTKTKETEARNGTK